MKWPWVSRELFDTVERHAEQYVRDYEDLGQRYVALVGEVVRMKREGFVTQPDPNEYIEPPLTVDEQDALRAQEEDDGN